MTDFDLPPLSDALFAPENFNISSLQDEIRAIELTGKFLKHFYLHLVNIKALSPEQASALAYGANYFLADFIIDDRRENIFHISAQRVRQFAGNWYIVKNLEPNMQELEGFLAAVLFFYQFCAECGCVDDSLPEQIAKECNDLEYYSKRIEDFWAIEDNGFEAWENDCSLKG